MVSQCDSLDDSDSDPPFELKVYGSKTHDPVYCKMCEDYIASHGLSHVVRLMGFGSPLQILPAAWCFVNSSISEGLPLAPGEAGLFGVSVVATEVGGTKDIVIGKELGNRLCPPQAPS